MEILETKINGLFLIKPRVFGDSRGYFFESFSEREFNSMMKERTGCTVDFVQDNESKSIHGVVRGLHFQLPPFTQAKLVRCVRGRVLDVAVDIRKGSPTYGKHLAVELSEDNHMQLFIPHGFAHGFAVLSDEAVFQYKCDNYYHPESDSGIYMADPLLDIDWRIPDSQRILSEKDKLYKSIAELDSPFEYKTE